MVHVQKGQKRAVYEYLMEEGVLVVKKDAYLKKHQHIESVPNLIVMMVIKSMKSKGYVEEVFSWQWSYYFLNENGIKFLVKTLGLPEGVVPVTYKKTKLAKPDEGKKEKGKDDEEDDDEKPKADAEKAD